MSDPAGARDLLESNKTAVVWLVVVNVLTTLATLVPLPLKWALAVFAGLALGSAALGYLAYTRAARAQKMISEPGASADAAPPAAVENATDAAPSEKAAAGAVTSEAAKNEVVTSEAAKNEAVKDEAAKDEVATNDAATSEAATGGAATGGAAPS
jgi:hypothetical protein